MDLPLLNLFVDPIDSGARSGSSPWAWLGPNLFTSSHVKTQRWGLLRRGIEDSIVTKNPLPDRKRDWLETNWFVGWAVKLRTKWTIKLHFSFHWACKMWQNRNITWKLANDNRKNITCKHWRCLVCGILLGIQASTFQRHACFADSMVMNGYALFFPYIGAVDLANDIEVPNGAWQRVVKSYSWRAVLWTKFSCSQF